MLVESQKKFRRGDIYVCDFADTGGSVQSGLRPALIIQNDKGNLYSTTLLVSPITSIVKKTHQPTHVILSTKFGLPVDSMVMLEQIITIDKEFHIYDYVGTVDNQAVIAKIDKALRVSLGL